MKIAKAVSLKIKKICDEKKISVNQLAKITGVTQSTLQNIVAVNSNNPKIYTIERICKGIGIDIKDFFNDDLFLK